MQMVGINTSTMARDQVSGRPPAGREPLEELDPAGLPMHASGSTGVESGESFPVGDAPMELPIVPYQPFLPRMILLGGHHNGYGEVKIHDEKECGDVAGPSNIAEQLPQMEGSSKQPEVEEISPSLLTKGHGMDQSSAEDESRSCNGQPRPSWLPEGWLYYDVQRTAGATAGKVDRYYYSPKEWLRFRSKSEVLSFIQHGRVVKREGRPRMKNVRASNAQILEESIEEQSRGSPSPSRHNLDTLRGIKRFIRSRRNH